MKQAPRYLYPSEMRPTADLAFYCRGPHGRFRYPNPTFHFLLIESGTVHARPLTGAFLAEAGDLVCFRPAIVNEYACPGPTVLYQADVLFAAPPHQQLIPWLEGVGPLPERVPLGAAFDEVRGYFQTICLEMPRRGSEHALRITAALFNILGAVTAVMQGTAEPSCAPLDAWQRALLHIDAHLNKPLRLGALARELDIGTDHFIRVFHARFGVTPKAYHTQARLREAVRLLRATPTPVKEVAFSLGFANFHAFTRLFKRHLGVPPSRLGSTRVLVPDPSVPSTLFPINTPIFPPHRTPADYLERGMPPGYRTGRLW